MSRPHYPVRRYAENNNGTYYKVNESHNVVHTVRGDRLCCLECRSNECEHVTAVERHLGLSHTKQVA